MLKSASDHEKPIPKNPYMKPSNVHHPELTEFSTVLLHCIGNRWVNSTKPPTAANPSALSSENMTVSIRD
jgi:hypothetical protein